MSVPELPNRYEPLARLGQGGGGEVWAVRDRYSGARRALKVLAEDASEREMAALVREAAALSGLEGLGLPRVIAFGRLPKNGRAFMVRELVEGESLERVLRGASLLESVLLSLISASEKLTVLHRTGLLHGDVKPANIIVQGEGSATLVDLGLAAPWQEGGTLPEGLSPRYAAPELFERKPLTVRAEVYALGVTLKEALDGGRATALSQGALVELGEIAARATALVASDRHPSVDELASAIRRAAGLSPPAAELSGDAALWPVVGIDAVSGQALDAAHSLRASGLLRLRGPEGSGRTALLRRIAWSLGVEGEPVLLFDAETTAQMIVSELEAHTSLHDVFVLVDDADSLDPVVLEHVNRARVAGARLLTVGGSGLGASDLEISMPALDRHAARDLLQRAIPSLGERLLSRVIELSGGRPGELRRLARLIGSEAGTSAADIERAIGAAESAFEVPEDLLERAVFFLDRGRYTDVQAALGTLPSHRAESEPRVAIAFARLELCLGNAAAALERLTPFVERPSLSRAEHDEVSLYLGRAHLGIGDYARVIETLGPLCSGEGPLAAEALAFHGLGLAWIGRRDEARRELLEAVQLAEKLGSPRLEAVTLASQGLELQRADLCDEARVAYERAILAAERAGDAGTLAVTRANLGGLFKVRGDTASAITEFEAALDMGRRSGRRQTARHALLNLANLDLYLGRVARARSRIETLEEQRAELAPVNLAQLAGLYAELFVQEDKLVDGVAKYEECAAAYEALGRGIDAAEAHLEGVLSAVRGPRPNVAELRLHIEHARAGLADAPAHRALLLLASARVAMAAGDEVEARKGLDQALAAARDAGQREWSWRALEARAELEEAGGQSLLAKRDREEAVAVLEEIAARLPRDLREVYWNDRRRAALRVAVPTALATAATEFMPFSAGMRSESRGTSTTRGGATTNLSQLSATPLERRLSWILEVNAELARELDVERLTARIIDFAVELARAERGLVLLKNADASLSIHTSRARGANLPDPEFSRSVAERVIESREPMVALNAQNDVRMKNASSVHRMPLESVACLPILEPSGEAIGALYVETRSGRGMHFERELPTLRAFADQVAIALTSARLINENRQRADELARSNRSLEEAQERLSELLGDRTEQLKRTRRRLRDVRETLYGHFGYHGLVGTSAAMRRVYALIERVKDTDIPVLITGESGTGKEVAARAIHETSPRSKSKMLGINCGAIPENLLESELFGHVRGAFTGADRERRGLFRECQGGTILLDEIGETPAKMQAGLLRVLQERKVRPVGGSQEESVDVRVICATNRDLQKMVAEHKFREDLYYRIQVVEIHLPALRERAEDIPQLVDHFLGIFAARYKREKKAVSREALRLLSEQEFPGNVRQLENVLLNAWVMSEEDELLPEDFDVPQPLASNPPPRREPALSPEPPTERRERRPVKGTTSEHHRNERDKILDALRSCNWNRVKAAELSGIPRRTFYRRLREYGIQ